MLMLHAPGGRGPALEVAKLQWWALLPLPGRLLVVHSYARVRSSTVRLLCTRA
jgi:hypothetical protein